jgi:CheY-like chemotaxis protein
MTDRTVLIVDDEPELRDTLRDVLQDEGYAVAVASNGKEALAALPSLRRPCAIILDIIMPVLSGRDFYQAMRADPRFADIPVLISTSDPSRAPAGVPVMRKPINLGRLVATVDSFFDQGDSSGGAGSASEPASNGPPRGGGASPPRSARAGFPDRGHHQPQPTRSSTSL